MFFHPRSYYHQSFFLQNGEQKYNGKCYQKICVLLVYSGIRQVGLIKVATNQADEKIKLY